MLIVTVQNQDKRFRQFFSICHTPYIFVHTSQHTFLQDGKEPEMVVLAGSHFETIECEHAMFIASGAYSLPSHVRCKKAITIVDSSNHRVMQEAATHHIPSLTCGLSCTDTFTLSSFRPDSAVVSLQRQITAFDGTVVEPFELPVTFSTPVEPFELLSCTAVFSMLGQSNPLTKLSSWNLPQ